MSYLKLIPENTFKLSRQMTSEFGLWDTIRVDKGREWFLMLYIQDKLSQYRNDVTKIPYLQTSGILPTMCTIS